MRPKTLAATGSVVVGLAAFAFVGFGVTHLLARRAAIGATTDASPLIGAPAGATAAIVSGLVTYYVLWRQLGVRRA
ncbi:hypothetical protein [Salinigranum marinum]|uniref:hypothetical protein n=1 Tax=Salinigranum marinum TaxID=1515595 RepID=UPI002989FD7D|nr:hypothetical protein [Salinigranum marinum]